MSSLKSISPAIAAQLQELRLPSSESHKGQNGKLMLIGGSELFHAASKWSLDMASKFVDMVFYSSVPDNNELIREAKGSFWNGIVVEREHVIDYIDEADCILIGPGMVRADETTEVTNYLLAEYPHKKWVIDAGALQMVNPALIPSSAIITPHQGEMQILLQKTGAKIGQLLESGVTVLLKGETDQVFYGEEVVEISGGNAGMTKGGTGDVLAGLVAALYCTNGALTAAVVGSFANKKAGERLYEEVGPFFNASDLVEVVPKVLWEYL